MIIQKFGGIAMQSKASRKHCLLHIKRALKKHGKTVVVVSAMGRVGDAYATDTLLDITDALGTSAKAKDLVAACGELIAAAVLSSELKQSGIDNLLLYGAPLGIITDDNFGDAEIIDIRKETLLSALECHDCLVIPGFQGITEDGEIATLGRGGSDLTAAILGATLPTVAIEYYKDVPGVMTGDPHLENDVELIRAIPYSKFLAMLNNVRPLIQKKAAEMAQQHHLKLHIRNVFSLESGTFVFPDEDQ
ncbi:MULTISPECIES: aspartate kinase [Rummeliibacillus]|uniref:amino acid kinase family protein n=1 Tax=Rummeliibacillus TaxID=648802 RepID=UPI0011B7CA2F|nr:MULTISPECIES: aspartate kinase [Rummeliibacillus]MBO2534455.1 aspartate kinase [Rummeliibacillus suwonensis]